MESAERINFLAVVPPARTLFVYTQSTQAELDSCMQYVPAVVLIMLLDIIKPDIPVVTVTSGPVLSDALFRRMLFAKITSLQFPPKDAACLTLVCIVLPVIVNRVQL